MKKIRITLRKGEARATCTHHYRCTDSPERTEWTGDRTPFSNNGRLLSFYDGIENLDRVCAHQAALCGAEYEIEDLGGEAQMWIDTVHFPLPKHFNE